MAKSLTQKLGSWWSFQRSCLSQVLFAIFSHTPCVHVVHLFATLRRGWVLHSMCTFVGASTLGLGLVPGESVRVCSYSPISRC